VCFRPDLQVTFLGTIRAVAFTFARGLLRSEQSDLLFCCVNRHISLPVLTIRSVLSFSRMNTSTSSRAASAAKLRKPAPRKFSPLLEGVSITKQLQNSSFGRFHAAVHDIKSYLPVVQFKLPTVIVVGGRSAGKSSLLENITKCPIFPRDPALCTKMPVKLQLIQVASESDSSVALNWRGNVILLESKDDILAEVAKIMKSVDSIVSDEVTVTICQASLLQARLAVHLPAMLCLYLCSS